MEQEKTGEESEKLSAEKALPRGLEQVSNMFLSHAQARQAPQENFRGSPEETPRTMGDQPLTVVLRPGRFLERQQLVSLLRKQAAALEDGMKVIDASIPCDPSGGIELLALDCTNKLAIIEVDDHFSDGLLLRGIEHFDWIVRNIPNVRRMYQGQVINFSFHPRVFFVAPEFSPSFRCATRHITALQINCLSYRLIALSGGTGVFFEHVFTNHSPNGH